VSRKTHKPSELLIATTRFTRENVIKSWWLTISAWTLLAVSICAVVLAPTILFKLLACLSVVAMMTRTFVIYHDYVHRAILKNSKVAELLFRAYGLFCLAPMTIWRRTHDFHHQCNGRIAKPSIGTYPVYTLKRFEASSKQQKRDYLRQRHPLTILFGYWFTFLFGMCIQPFLADPRKHSDSLVAILLHAVYLFLFAWSFGPLNMLFGIFIPNLLTFAFGAYLFYVQHNFPGVQYATDGEWTYELSALESSSFLELSPLMEWITGNIGYHHVHHLNSRIPFYRLPEAMEQIPALQNPIVSNLSIKEVRRCLKLKVWDEGQGHMIGLSSR